MVSNSKSDFLGTEPVGRLLVKFATPAMISTFINCIYNIVDRLYIGRGVGPEAQAGLSLTFPIMVIMTAFGMLIGLGSSSTVSIFLGEQKKDDAEKVLGQAFAMMLLFCITVQALFLVFLDELLVLLGGTPEAIPYAKEYLVIILYGNLFQHVSFGLSNVIRAEGNSYKSMYIIAVGAGLNIILDPIFIFVFDKGIAGAAYATVLSMFVSSLLVFIHFYFRQGVLKLHFRYVRIYRDMFWKVLSIGMAPFFMQIVNSIIVSIYNQEFKAFAADSREATMGIAAYGIANTVMFCMLMPAFGISQGMQPVIGFNCGAKLYARVRRAYLLSAKISTGMTLFMALVMFFCSRLIAACFTKDEQLIEITSYALRTASYGFTFIAPGIMIANYYQSMGRAVLSLFFSLTRQVIFLIPALLLLPRIMGFNGIWWGIPTSDAISGILALAIAILEMRRLSRLIPAPDCRG